MNKIPKALYTAEQTKKLDQLVASNSHLSPYQLMCRAGQAALTTLREEWDSASSITVFCGPGNNGGDGLVLARLAKTQGLSVTLFSVGEKSENKSSESNQASADWLSSGGEIIPFQGQAITGDVIVDAMLGTGVHGKLKTAFQEAILAINQSKKPVLAIDLPSGLNSDTGDFEQVVKASITITFIAMKLGLLMGSALDVAGKVLFDNLGVSTSSFPEIKPIAHTLDYDALIPLLPKRKLSSHKGNYGHICIVGGGHTGYSGAVCLSGEAALRAGAGLVSCVVSPISLPLMARAPAELMVYGLKRPKEIEPLLDKATVIILGPGLGETKWSKNFFQAALKTSKPLVVDADGLNWLAKYPQKRSQWILTPHPGEAARLLGKDTKAVQEDRLSAACSIQKKYGGVIVLKGASTIVVTENGEVFINAEGVPSLATGGTGDVLAGLIGSLAGQGLSLTTSAQLGVKVHTMAAELEQTMGVRGMLASDLFLHIRSLLNPYPTSIERLT